MSMCVTDAFKNSDAWQCLACLACSDSESGQAVREGGGPRGIPYRPNKSLPVVGVVGTLHNKRLVNGMRRQMVGSWVGWAHRCIPPESASQTSL